MNDSNPHLKEYITRILEKDLREDGRKLDEYRKVEVEVNPIPRANGS